MPAWWQVVLGGGWLCQLVAGLNTADLPAALPAALTSGACISSTTQLTSAKTSPNAFTAHKSLSVALVESLAVPCSNSKCRDARKPSGTGAVALPLTCHVTGLEYQHQQQSVPKAQSLYCVSLKRLLHELICWMWKADRRSISA